MAKKKDLSKVPGGRASLDKGAGIHGMSKEEKSLVGKANGSEAYQTGSGIHSLTSRQHLRNSRKGGCATFNKKKGYFSPDINHSKCGRISGINTLNEGIGIHALSQEELSRYGRKGGREGTLARGQTPWTSREKKKLVTLVNSGRYTYLDYRGIERTDYDEIRFILENNFGILRVKDAAKRCYSRIKSTQNL